MTYTPPARTAVDFVITAYTKPDISGRANELSVYTIPSLTAVNFAISSYTLPVFNRVNFELEQAQGVTGTLAVTLDALTLSGTGEVVSQVTGTLAQTLAALTLSGSAAVSNGPTGNLDATLDALTLSGTGAVTGEGAGGSGYLAPEIFYPRPKKKVEEDEAIAMVLISLLDEAW